jgi:hypothetical protein
MYILGTDPSSSCKFRDYSPNGKKIFAAGEGAAVVILDAFAEKVPWTLFLVQMRPGKPPFQAKARPRLQSGRRERPF